LKWFSFCFFKSKESERKKQARTTKRQNNQCALEF
jgi:hypothetical protein